MAHALGNSNSKIEENYRQALQAFESGDVAGAKFLLQNIVLSSPNHANARNDLSAIYFQEQDFELALRNIRIAAQAAPQDQVIQENWRAISAALGVDQALTPERKEIQVDYGKLLRWEQSIEQVTSKVSAAAAALLPENGVLIDVGANVGLFTDQILRTKAVQAYLFEPVPEYWEYCRQRFAGRSNVVVENLALSDGPGKLELFLGAENLGWNTIVREKTDASMKPVVVEALTFDDYCKNHNINRIDVIKIDVEGGEYKVLAGMRETLKRLEHKPFIICEIGWGPNSHPHWNLEVEAFEWLFANGYERLDYNVAGTSDVIFRPVQLSAQSGLKKNIDSPTANRVAQGRALFAVEPSKAPIHELPFITVGIPTRNRLDPLFTLLESIERQTFKNFELLISDDGDKFDLSREIRSRFPQLKFRRVQGPKKSLPTNRQCIVDHACTEFVVMCDDDHLMKDDCLEQLVRTIVVDKSIGIVSAIWPHIHENPQTVNYEAVCGKDDFRIDLDNIDQQSDFWWKNGTEMFKAFQDRPRIFESQFAGGGCLIYRKSAVQVVGGFPDDLSVVSFREDTDLSHRVFLQGYRVLINPQAMAYHLVAQQGGCRDSKQWAKNFVEDGLHFLNKLKRWRTVQEQLKTVESRGPIRVAMFYDEKGWAWWHRAHHIKRNIGPGFEIDILQLGTRIDHDRYDLIFLFDHNVVKEVPGIPLEKLIVGNSCPLLIDGAKEVLNSGGCLATVVNNYQTYLTVRDSRNAFCCQNGVDIDLFKPSANPVRGLVACWAGHSKSIGKKGLELIREACAREGVELRVVDANDRAKGVEANSQEWLRDNLYYNSSVYICASEFEGTPNPALEAMACGLPVISTRVGNMPELIVDGYNGYLVDRTVDDIARALRELKQRNWLELGRNARHLIENGWSWRDQCIKYAAMFRELRRQQLFGDVPEEVVSPEVVAQIAKTRMVEHQPPPGMDAYLLKREGKFIYLSGDFLEGEVSETTIRKAAMALGSLPPFFLHYGGSGDALLLLSTFYDSKPEQVVLSVTTSIEASRAFFEAFPALKSVLLVPLPDSVDAGRIIRALAANLPNCLGRGITPSLDHTEEWCENIDLRGRYGVEMRPRWVDRFRGEKITTPQVVVAPKGSLIDMPEGKQNIIDPRLWTELLADLLQQGVKPIIIGTPGEAELYPTLDGAIDRRSFSFEEQMRLVANADLLIGADSWAKTFAALAGVEAVVFPPMVEGSHKITKDASANIFLHPWPTIAMVTDLSQLQAVLRRKLTSTGSVNREAAMLLSQF